MATVFLEDDVDVKRRDVENTRMESPLETKNRDKLAYYVWYKLAPYMKRTFWLDWKNAAAIENYSRIFSYFILCMTMGVGVFLAAYTDSYAPIVFTFFLAMTSFLVGDYFDAEKKAVFLKRCKPL